MNRMSTEGNKAPQFDICILEELTQLTLLDLCHACAAQEQQISELVEIGVLEPKGREPAQWSFDGVNLHRARVALRLQRDLEVDLAGAALALTLLDEIASLRRRLNTLGDLVP